MPGHRVEVSRLVAVEPPTAFDALLAASLPEVFSNRFAAFPAVSEVSDAPEQWCTVGQTRIIHLTDGGRLREQLTSIDPPVGYSYLLDDIHGPLRPFVSRVEAAWSVNPEGTGARISWAWTLYPTAPPARLTMNVLARMWKGYADRALAELETILTRP